VKATWSIKSIKHWADGTWDAILISEQQGRTAFNRAFSKDGFNWLDKFQKPIPDAIQGELVATIGDMEMQGIRVVVF